MHKIANKSIKTRTKTLITTEFDVASKQTVKQMCETERSARAINDFSAILFCFAALYVPSV